MNYKHIIVNFGLLIAAFFILLICSCTNTPTETDDQKSTEIQHIGREIATYYKKSDHSVHVLRILEPREGKLDIFRYQIDTSIPENAKQTFTSEEHLTAAQFKNAKINLQGYNWTKIKGKEILFVQLQPKNTTNESRLLDDRQRLEDQISSALVTQKLGDWFAGDIGPGGANMLFTVLDTNTSIQVILQVLHENKIDTDFAIGRRVLVSEKDWFYEVVYPIHYSGNFNTM